MSGYGYELVFLFIYLFIYLFRSNLYVSDKVQSTLKEVGLVKRNLVWNYEVLIRNTQDRIEDEWVVGIRNGDMNNSGRGCLDLDLGIVS